MLDLAYRIGVIKMSTQTLIEKIRRGQLDIAISALPWRGFPDEKAFSRIRSLQVAFEQFLNLQTENLP
jgi:GH24 family phage-related lysozyme (muramidase)